MRISSMLKKFLRKEKEKGKVENVLVQLMKYHISTYPHSYFLRKGPKELIKIRDTQRQSF